MFFLKVATRVYYFPGLNGSCRSAHKHKGERVTKLIYSTDIATLYIGGFSLDMTSYLYRQYGKSALQYS